MYADPLSNYINDPHLCTIPRSSPCHFSLQVSSESQLARKTHMSVYNILQKHAEHLFPYIGLTLISCIWKSPEQALNMSTTNALSDCTIMLYVMAERWPTAGRYRDTFERLKQLVLGRGTAEEQDDDNIILEPSTPAVNDSGLGGASNPQTNTEYDVARHATGGSASITLAEVGVTNRYGNMATGSVIPNVIRNLVREPFPLWEGESFNLNFEAFMPPTTDGGPRSGETPWTGGGGEEAFDLGRTAASFDFTFSPTEFGQPADYDFDPVAFDYSPPGVQLNEYGGILEGLAGHRPSTRL